MALFHWPRREQRAILYLMVILLLSTLVGGLVNRYMFQDRFDYAAYKQEIDRYVEGLESELLPFDQLDINEVTASDLLAAGLNSALANRWVNYRSAIGGFTNVHQVLRLYGMDTAWFLAHAHHLAVNGKRPEITRSDDPSARDTGAEPVPRTFIREAAVEPANLPTDTDRIRRPLSSISIRAVSMIGSACGVSGPCCRSA